MADKIKTGRIKKYGVCLNDKCEKYKIIQEVIHGELECPGCKKKLSPCAPPKKKKQQETSIHQCGGYSYRWCYHLWIFCFSI